MVPREAHNLQVSVQIRPPQQYFVEILLRGSPKAARNNTKHRLDSSVLCYFEHMYYVYILLSQQDDRTYAGYTNDIERRLRGHNRGKVDATQHRRPLELFYLEKFNTEKEAKEREEWYKSSSGRNKMKKLFEEKGM